MEQFPKTLSIRVSQDNIKEGTVCSSLDCPIAIATKDAYPQYIVWVGLSHIKLFTENGSAMYYMPWNARMFIRSYDNREYVMPFGFEAPREV